MSKVIFLIFAKIIPLALVYILFSTVSFRCNFTEWRFFSEHAESVMFPLGCLAAQSIVKGTVMVSRDFFLIKQLFPASIGTPRKVFEFCRIPIREVIYIRYRLPVYSSPANLHSC